jgi:prepilin peptidase CpaA
LVAFAASSEVHKKEAVVMLLTWSSLLSLLLLIASIAILLATALHDIVARTVPNWMAATLAILGVASQLLHGHPLAGLVSGFVVFLLAAFCWRRGWLGGGDVKLLAAAALVVPPGDVVNFVAAVALAGAALALAYLGAGRVTAAPSADRPSHLVARAVRVERWRMRRGGPLPYALAIAAGFLFTTL